MREFVSRRPHHLIQLVQMGAMGLAVVAGIRQVLTWLRIEVELHLDDGSTLDRGDVVQWIQG
jgi:hypothetical protein